MEIVPNLQKDHIDSTRIEHVEKHKHEYKFLGSFLRTAGLNLYAYDGVKNLVYELKIKYSNTITLKPIDGKLIPIDEEAAKCTVDSRHEVFEALNMRTALRRVEKYKNGKISKLSNLRVPSEFGCKLF